MYDVSPLSMFSELDYRCFIPGVIVVLLVSEAIKSKDAFFGRLSVGTRASRKLSSVLVHH